ncbi:MAG: alpha/beta hydrolase [Acidimicrobiia bacterium]|nr:alpha/beta hydrolase [Acidimicrobiia bacterium]
MSGFAAVVLFVVGVIGLVGAVNALRRPRPERHPALQPWWLPAMLVAELIPIRIAFHAVIGVVAIWLGALEHPTGQIGVALTVLTWIGYGVLQARAHRALPVLRRALAEIGIDHLEAEVEWRRALAGYPYRTPDHIEVLEDVEYSDGLTLDLYRTAGDGKPIVVQIHGGGWRGGHKRQQARPLLHRMARDGWLAASVSYPLSPQATFPDHLIALKRAIAFLRKNAAEFGGDGSFIAVTGGSAGGHLSALLALTANRPEYQPGFESTDTSVQAAVPLYGVYDFLNRNETRDNWPLIPRAVMKEAVDPDSPRYREASPLDQVHQGAPPFFVIHGTHDSLVRSDEARHFVDALRAESRSPVAYAEVPGATHAFDIAHSVRTHQVVSGVQAFLDEMAEQLRPSRHEIDS